MAHAWNLSTSEFVKAGGLRVQKFKIILIHSEFEVSLGCMTLSQEKTNNKENS